MTVLLLDRLSADIQRLGDLSPRPPVAECVHDVLRLEVISKNTKGPDGTEAVIGVEVVDGKSAHGCNFSCLDRKVQPKLLYGAGGFPPAASPIAGSERHPRAGVSGRPDATTPIATWSERMLGGRVGTRHAGNECGLPVSRILEPASGQRGRGFVSESEEHKSILDLDAASTRTVTQVSALGRH